MSTSDKLIIAGVVMVPLGFGVALGIDAILNGYPDWVGMFLSVAVAVAAGLITTGILMRKNR